jgi:hypothetical protein
MSVCLDSWAILAWLDGEQPALTRVDELIASRPVVSWVNLVDPASSAITAPMRPSPSCARPSRRTCPAPRG